MLSKCLNPGPEIVAADGPFAVAAAGNDSRAVSAAASRSRRLMVAPWSFDLLHRPDGMGSGGDLGERRLEIHQEILGGLQADGEPDEVPRRGERPLRSGGVRHARRQLDETLDAAERFREFEDLRACDESGGLLLRLCQERDHPAKVAHLLCSDRVAWVSGQSGIQNLLDTRMALEKAGDRMSVVAVLTHAYGQRLDPAQHEPAVQRPGDGPARLLQEEQPLRDRGIVRRSEATNDVRVSTEVLRCRVHDDVRAELEWPL